MIFTFSPTPTVSWERLGEAMPINRSREDDFGQALIIENIQFSDAGRYECQGINEDSSVPERYSFELTASVYCYSFL